MMVDHVEFLGLPDSGKTTCFNEIKSILKQRGAAAKAIDEELAGLVMKDMRELSGLGSTFVKRHANLLRIASPLAARSTHLQRAYYYSEIAIGAYSEFVLENMELSGLVTEAVHGGLKDNREQIMVMRMFFSLFSRYQVCARSMKPGELLVMDEGFCQRALSLWGRIDSGEDEPPMKKYLDLIPLPRVLLVIRLEPGECERRYAGRKYRGLLKDLDLDDRIARLERIEALMDRLVPVLEKKGVQVFNLENSGAREVSVPSVVIDSLSNLVSGHR